MAYISENRQNFDFFEKGPFKALLNQRKIFSKRLLKMHSFPKKKFYLKKMSVHPLGRILSYIDMIECTGNNDKNIYWPPMSRGHYRECMARTYVGTFSLCRCQKKYYETSFSSHTLLVTGPPPTHSKRKKSVQQNCVI